MWAADHVSMESAGLLAYIITNLCRKFFDGLITLTIKGNGLCSVATALLNVLLPSMAVGVKKKRICPQRKMSTKRKEIAYEEQILHF